MNKEHMYSFQSSMILQSMGSLRVGHNWATSLSLFTFMHWRRKWQPIPCSCLENPRDGGGWWAAVYGVAQSWTRLKQLSIQSSASSSSSEVSNGGLRSIWRTLSQRDDGFPLKFSSPKKKKVCVIKGLSVRIVEPNCMSGSLKLRLVIY